MRGVDKERVLHFQRKGNHGVRLGNEAIMLLYSECRQSVDQRWGGQTKA